MPHEKFTVDTHLFRELGELLVGRNSTALVELIKNAYDADATKVVIDGRYLDDPKRGVITISDDGIGMSPRQFRDGFLRIASRLKESGQRKSARFRRRYTGAKGIGRLAAHKLARFIEIESRPDPEHVLESDELLRATIDWDMIESLLILDMVEESGAVVLETEPRRRKTEAGTTITLRRPRKVWTQAELVEFQAEVESFPPPPVLIDLPKGLAKGELLFGRPVVAEITGDDPGIRFDLTGEFATGDDFWPQVAQSAHWLIEVDASSRRRVRVNILPTRHGLAEFPDARPSRFEVDPPASDHGPFFQSRILIREGGAGDRAFKQWLRRSFGIRVYLEGFRVLPFGEPKNDWLSLDADYKTRPRTLSYLTEMGVPESAGTDEDEGLVFLGNSSYFGAVFLTTSGAPSLRMLVNREGFASDPSYDHMVDVLRTAVYLSVRVRAAAKKHIRDKRREERQGKPPLREDLKQAVERSVTRATELAQEARQFAAKGDYQAASSRIEQAATEFSRGSEVSERLMTEGAVLRVLASVGTQMAAFVHEINSILGMSKALGVAVGEIEKELSLSAAQRRKLAQLRSAIEDLRRGIERQASYLTDVVSPDARRRRSRQKLAERFDAGQRLVAGPAARRGVAIKNEIPADLKSPPMFPAELTVVFSNLLTNAVKAAGEGGCVRATGGQDREGQVILRVENTGSAVDLEDAERWFRPFESTTLETDPVLGQGMGMGLPITRNMLEEYGASIQFVSPSRGFATAIEIVLPR
jgi:signal transduction histidine kinase